MLPFYLNGYISMWSTFVFLSMQHYLCMNFAIPVKWYLEKCVKLVVQFIAKHITLYWVFV